MRRSIRDVYTYTQFVVGIGFVVFTKLRYGLGTLPPQDYSPVPEGVCCALICYCFELAALKERPKITGRSEI